MFAALHLNFCPAKRVLIEEGKKAAAEGRLAAALRKYETAMVTLPEVRDHQVTLICFYDGTSARRFRR